MRRCAWAGEDPLMTAYHDREWGVPSRSDHHLFELVTLEGAQAGLSWFTILKKRENYRRAFQDFDPARVARFDECDVESLLQDAGIVRHRGKIESAINNARKVLEVQAEAGSFAEYVWSFVGGAPIVNRWKTLSELPSETPEAREMSRDMRRRGFRFLGPTTCYAFMQAAGLVNDHELSCYRHPEIAA
jgi:DNA-3-methyladenine glycosylase I